MRMDGVHHGLDGGFGFHRRDGFRDQLEGLRSDDVDAQDFAEFLIGDHLHETVVLSEDGGLAVGGERKLADLHLVALRARLRFRQAHAADARLRIGRARNAIAVDRSAGLPAMWPTATMPSMVATCASCGVPATTSPMA